MKLHIVVLSMLLSVSMQAQAIPTLFFDGDLSYSQTDGLLTIDAVLTGYQDTSSAVVTGIGSSLTFQASFLGSSFNGFTTSGNFDTASLAIIGGDSTDLLLGSLMNLVMSGVNGYDFGSLTGQIAATGGSLLSDFTSGSDFLAFELNISTVFGAKMFDADFTSQLGGRVEAIQAVPEASSLMLVFIGMLGLIVLNRRKLLAK